MLNFGDEDGDTKYQVTSPSEIEYNERQIVPIMSQQPPTPRQMQLVQQPQQQIIQRELIPVVQSECSILFTTGFSTIRVAVGY
jgi:hypothetical protein